MQKFSLHTHTKFSDGYYSAEEMLKGAKIKSLNFYGVSDHLTIHPKLDLFESFNRLSFDGQLDIWEKHFENLRNIGKEIGLNVKCGIEVDFINDDNWMKDFENFKNQLSYDYLISGTHCMYTDINDIVYAMDNPILKNLPSDQQLKICKNHWKNIQVAVKTGWFDLIAHLDLIKRLEFLNYECDEKEELIQLLIKSKQPIELNTKVMRKCGEYGPSDKIINRLISNNHPICLSDDAHRVENICYDFDNAYAHLEGLGHKNWWKPNF